MMAPRPHNTIFLPMHPPSTSSELSSSVPREPEPSSSQLSRGNLPNSDDDGDDDVRLVRHQSRTSAGEATAAGAGHHRDGPSAAEPSSSSHPKAKAVVTEAPAGVLLPAPFSLSLTLRNTGSVARDHLASERTFLAYVRTSLSFASAGVALVQLFRVSVSASANGPSASQADVLYASYARPLGATLVGFGMAVLVMGTQRYFLIQRALPQGLFPAARLSVFLQAVSLATLVGIVFGILVAAR